MNSTNLIIDGSYGEGGGQILRTALALSCVTKKPFKIYNIRKNRPKPGLAQQHLTCILAAKEISSAKVNNAEIRSTCVEFNPNELNCGEFKFDISTAGAVTLVLQAITLPLIFAKSKTKLILKGGTHTNWAPIYDYFKSIFCRMLLKLGVKIESKLIQYGFYPKGGGQILVTVYPVDRLKSINLTDRGRLVSLKGVACVANLGAHIARRERKACMELLKNFNPEIEIRQVHAKCPGTYIFLCANFENSIAGFSRLGERGKPAEVVGEEVAKEFLQYYESGSALDKYMGDQILPYLAVAGGGEYTTCEITRHLLANAWVIEKFLPVKIEIEGKQGEPGKVKVRSK